MKVNLLATTAAIALLASGGAWAQAQSPASKHDEKAQAHEQKAQAHEQKAQAHEQKAKQEPLAAKQKQADELRTKNTAAEVGKPGDQHAQDAHQKNKASRDQMNAKKDEGSKASEHAQSKKPDSAADNKDLKKDQSRAAKDNSKPDKTKNQAAKETKDQTSTKAAEQAKDRGQKADQSKQSADKSKPNDKPNSSAAADSKTGNTSAKNGQPTDKGNKNAAQNNRDPSQHANQQAGMNDKTSTKISEQDRTKIFSNLKSEKRVSNRQVNIDVTVGQRLPARVRPRPLPRTVVQIAPEYRGYDYVMVRDEIAIVRPGTREVVDVIREPGSSSSFASTTTTHQGGSIHLSNEQRDTLRKEARRFTTSQVSSSGSSCLSLHPVPASLANGNTELRSYQYLAIGDDIILVNPKDKTVVDVIH